MSCSYKKDLEFIEKISDVEYRIKKDFVPNMNVIKIFLNFRIDKI